MYSTFQQYQQRGGKLPEEQYLANAQKASETIDYCTMGQAATAEHMHTQLSACECDLVDVLYQASVVASGVKSENNDGYSVTYATGEEVQSSIQTILKKHLSFPENLLVAAGWAFV